MRISHGWAAALVGGMVIVGLMDSARATTFTFTTIDVPRATFTQVNGINDAGQTVGFFTDSAGRHGFLDSGGTFTRIDAPFSGVNFTGAGINSAGQIVGLFIDSAGTHGFLATPTATPVPEPGSVALLGVGLFALGILRRRTRGRARQRTATF